MKSIAHATVLCLALAAGQAHAAPPDVPGILAGARLAQSFSCTPRKTCGQMRSCAEACHALVVCGDTRRDGDHDGIPCEKLCSRPCPR